MKFNAAAFDRHLKNMGQRVLWRKAFACACVNPASGAPDPKHALCSGKGRIWLDPMETVTGVASQETINDWAQTGQWESGDMVLSIPQSSPMWDAGQYDRITMLNSTDSFSQPLVRGAPTERLIFSVESVSRVFWLNPANRNQIVDGAIPSVSEDGFLSWSGAGEPPPGVTYSVTGSKYSDYFIFNKMSSDRNEHSGMRLPKKLVARRFDLFGR